MRIRETAALSYRTESEDAQASDADAAGAKVASQIRKLKAIPSDWHHDETSNAPDPDGLEWLARRFEQDYPADAPTPYIFPDPEGTVTALWKLSEEIQVEIEFNLAARTAERWIHNRSNLSAQRDILDLDTPNALDDVGARNTELVKAG